MMNKDFNDILKYLDEENIPYHVMGNVVIIKSKIIDRWEAYCLGVWCTENGYIFSPLSDQEWGCKLIT